jgi:lysophospholipase L1-like esterase
MKKAFTYLLLCTIFLSACSRGESYANNESVQQKNQIGLEQKEDIPVNFFPEPVTIVSVGDSLTEGVGDSTNTGGYVPYLQQLLEKEPGVSSADFINYGVRGNKTGQLLNRLDQSNIKNDILRADSVVITIGGNDVMQVIKENFTNLQMSEFEQAKVGYEERLRQILTTVRSYNSNANIYLIGLYNPFSKWLGDFHELDTIMDDWNKASKDIVSGFDHAHFIEIGDIFKNSDDELLFKEDYFHPNDKGYELIAGRIFKTMGNIKNSETTLEANAKGDED